MQKLKEYLKLFGLFFKIGLFTFGGGYAMIALLQTEFVEKKKWLTTDEFSTMLAIAESTPGPVAVNSATFIGYRLKKFWGAAVATLGVCLPSLIIIYLISLFFNAFLELRLVQYAFAGIRVGVVFLILNAGLKMFAELKKSPFEMIVFGAVALAMVLLDLFAVNFSTVFYILLGGIAGVFSYLLTKLKGGKK